MFVYSVLVCLIFLSIPNLVEAKVLFHQAHSSKQEKSKPVKNTKLLASYEAYFREVFEIIDTNYYVKPDPAKLEEFILKFKTKIYPALAAEGKSDDYVKWRATWYMVDGLKTKDDKFSQFYPPKPAQKFEREALGQRIDLGVEGKKNDKGYLVTRLEPRADAYAQGLREDDVIITINDKSVLAMSPQEIEQQLNPLINTSVKLAYETPPIEGVKTINVVSKEYFKQTVFFAPVAIPGVFCLEIPKFNRTSGEDLYRFLKVVQSQHPRGLILDLRGNPGGPPLAAREMSAFFLRGGEEFAYFQRRGQPKSDLDVPVVDDQFKYTGPMVILVNADSGSAAELFTGIMQFRGRALVLGETTAGQVLLKSMFPVKDGAMVALVTGLGYYPDNHTFGFKGITPDRVIEQAPKDGLINLAAAMILYAQQANQVAP